MIKPITKEYFYKCVGEVKNWIKTFNFEFSNFTMDYCFVRSSGALYFEIPKSGFFAYIPGLKLLVIPGQFDKLDVEKDSGFDLTDWVWEETGKGHNKEYTVNLFNRTSERYSDDMVQTTFGTLNNKYPGGIEIHLENTRIGYSKNIELKIDSSAWRSSILIAYEEKLHIPFDGRKFFELDTDIKNILLWSQKKH